MLAGPDNYRPHPWYREEEKNGRGGQKTTELHEVEIGVPTITETCM